MDTELLPVPRRSLHSSCAINLEDGRRGVGGVERGMEGGREGSSAGGVIRRVRDVVPQNSTS